LFLALAAAWALWDPLLSYMEAAYLGDPASNQAKIEAALLARGRGALPALRRGLKSAEAPRRLRCAGLLALLGEPEGEEALFETLRGAQDAPGALAEHLLLTAWDRRRGPEPGKAARALSAGRVSRQAEAEQERKLDELLAQYPAWAGGYVARARGRLRQDDPRGAVRDALYALLIEPRHFEAALVLARAYKRLDYPEQALDCMERALAINPRLAAAVSAEMKELRAAAQAERERRLKERRLELPVL
jgi:tetratricopeptide (TPR) repeat protein